MKPRVSFVIPAYNADAFLRETLDSCLDQSIKQLEVIVVNDGSTDGTKELIEWYARKDERIVPIHCLSNVGRSEARNIGNRKAQADIILVLDADDKATRNRAKDTLACFQLKKPDLVYGGFITIDTFGNMETRRVPVPFSRENSIKHRTHGICHSTVAYRRGMTMNVQYQGGEYSDLGIDDWKFIWDAHLKGYKFAYVKNPLCYYRIVDGTISHTRDENKVNETKEKYLASVV